MKKEAYAATIFGILGNIFLFLLKITFGLMFNSIALISDAINSLTDIINSVVIYVAVKVSSKKADKTHPFGHFRAEPIASLVVAISIAIIGFEVFRRAIARLLDGSVLIFGILPIVVLVVCIGIKLCMTLYFTKVGRKINSPAILASAVDSRNDMLISIVALIGIMLSGFGYMSFDAIAGMAIGCWVVFVGYQLGREHIDYLMGKRPNKELINNIEKRALSIKGVKRIHDVKAHYVGHLVHVEICIELNKKLKLVDAHNIGEKVERLVEELPSVNKAFIHIDPV